MNPPPFSPVRIVFGAFLAVTAVVAVSGLSRLPYPVHAEDEAMVRLSWRLSGLTRTTCVPVPPEAQEALPVHMRRTESCEERFPAYRLLVKVADRVVEERVVRGAGARGDRPLVVHQEIAVSPGTHRIEVEFEPLEASEDLPAFHYREEVHLPARGVALLTLDTDSRSFAVRVGDPASAHRESP